MQKYIIDIDRALRRPLVIYAKQNDQLTRAIEVILQESGKPFIPDEATNFSVRFGKANYPSGWYDTVEDADGNSIQAVTQQDNRLTVLLVSNMLTKAGTNEMAIIMAGQNGSQLATWNFEVHVDHLPGEDSQEIVNYYNMWKKVQTDALDATNEALDAAHHVTEVISGMEDMITEVSDAMEDLSLVRNAGEEQVPAGKVWQTTESGAGWVTPTSMSTLSMDDFDKIDASQLQEGAYYFIIKD